MRVNSGSELLTAGLGAHRAGKLPEAEGIYRQILASEPENTDVMHLLGVLSHQSGRHAEAVELISQAIELSPEVATFHCNLGAALQVLGKRDRAIEHFQTALRLRPNYHEAETNLGAALRSAGRIDEAIAAYNRALRLNPNSAAAHYNLAISLRARRQLTEAATSFQRALQLKPNYLAAYRGLGNTLKDMGQLASAMECYQRGLKLKHDDAGLYHNLALVQKDLGELDASIESFRTSLRFKPDYSESLTQLTHLQLQVCDWTDFETNVTRVKETIAAGRRAAPWIVVTLPTTPGEQLASARCWAESIGTTSPRVDFTRQQKKKLKIGYLSADFREHPVANLAAELYERHDRDRFQVVAYSFGPHDGSPMRQRLEQAFDEFIDIESESVDAAAERIRQDGVDILVDLMGYTRLCRVEILAARPAPIQVNFLGYPGTMGADFVDYIIADTFTAPPENQQYFSEKLVHVPGSYQVNDNRRPIAEQTPSRSSCDLPEDGVVFCSFNQTYKFTPESFDIWMRLLGKVRGSVLWLLESNSYAKQNLREHASNRGIDPSRLVFAPRVPTPEHLARTKNADLFLDTWPCNAHTTASDALWSGCPVLTMAGDTFASRVAGSLLRAVGLPELITDSPQSYEALALELANNPQRLRELRNQLAEGRQSSGLFDGGRFAKCLEQAYEQMWSQFCEGSGPAPISIEQEIKS